MPKQFEIIESNKTGITSPESYIVVRRGISYLRIIGREPCWALMTATANEDDGNIRVCQDQRRLIEAARRLGAELATPPVSLRDIHERPFLLVCGVRHDSGETPEQFHGWFTPIMVRFFELYDGEEPTRAPAAHETRDLYDVLAIDDSGADVYLGDGVWIDRYGSWHDRGR